MKEASLETVEVIAWFLNAVQEDEGQADGYANSFVEQCVGNGGRPPIESGHWAMEQAREILTKIGKQCRPTE